MRNKWYPLVAICLGAFMLLVDVTIVTVALPDMAVHLNTGFSALQWVMDAYAVALAALLLGAGSLADLVGRRRVYLAGLALFAAASLACGLAPNAALLVGARAVQGVGAAAMYATTMALLNATYSGRDRGLAFGMWGAVNGGAAAAGPLLGGLLTAWLGWRSIFLVNLPVCVVAVWLTRKVLAESRDPAARRVDLPGTVTFTAASALITYVLIRGGWTSAHTLVLLAAGLIALAVFVLVELRRGQPMLDLGLFRRPAFVGIMLASALLSVAAFAYLPYTSLWLQSRLGLGAIGAGAVLLPLTATGFVVAAMSGRFLHRLSPRLMVSGGLLLVGAGALLEAALDTGSSWHGILPGLAIAGVGVGLSTPSLASAAMASVPPERGGMAAGAVNTFRQLGYALGIAVLGSVVRSDSLDSSYVVAGVTGIAAAVLVFGVVRESGTSEPDLQPVARAIVLSADRAGPR